MLAWIAAALVVAGLFFTIVAVVGLVRMPDLYTRAHATSKADTLGTVLTLAGVALAFQTAVPRAKLVLLTLFLLITNPTATHAITRAAYDQDIEPQVGETDSESVDPQADSQQPTDPQDVDQSVGPADPHPSGGDGE
jgi:multicomponent Na+:H+ antiporter subunit G